MWLCVSLLMVLSLILASCGPSEPTTPTTPTTPTSPTTPTTPTQPSTPAESEKPQYGGTFTFVFGEPFGFDPAFNFMMECKSIFLTNEELLMGDWAKGPAGTGETDWTNGCLGIAGLFTGQLCESWEFTDDTTITFHLRQGVHWHDKAPVNGREYTAEDAAWSIERLWANGVHSVIGPKEDALISATAKDKYTLVLKVPAHAMGGSGIIYSAAWLYQFAPEVVEEYGDMKDWRNSVGTGAFMLTDYVPGSALTYKKNPNYWGTNPVGPGKGDQLPYVDELKQLIIADSSTQLAALRTGKIDFSLWTYLTLDDARSLMEQRPEMKYRDINGEDNHLYFRLDKDLPFNDIKVRQALTLSIDKQELIDDYYAGDAFMLGVPYPPYKAWEPFYTPLDQMPSTPQLTDEGSECSVQELFGAQNIEKAKQLLADAGYPDGFNCKIISQTSANTDFLSIIREYFAEVNVNLEIEQKEDGVFRSMRRSRTYEEGVYTASPTSAFPYDMHNIRTESFDCFTYFEHPYTRNIYNEMRKVLAKDDEQYTSLLKESVPFILEQSIGIWLPLPKNYRMWWPWLKNYNGEGSLGIDDQMLVAN